MKRILLTGLLLLASGTIALQAQNTAITPAAQEINLQNFWFNSANAAALAFSPLDSYSDVSLSYQREQGEFKHALEPLQEGSVTAYTSGALQFKGFSLWGDFSYHNSFSRGSLYNTNLYEPRFSMPYYIADANPSDWKRQSYDMGFKVSAPKMAGDRLALGLTTRYCDKVGAKQMDPRGVSYVLALQLTPSIAFAISDNAIIGLSIDYERYKERTSHSCENYLVDQQVAIMRGLGVYTQGVVGGNLGAGNYLYSGNKIGGQLEFSVNGSSSDWFISAGGSYQKITVLERPSFPRMRGATGTIAADLALKANLGRERNHRISLLGNYSSVTGYEYAQELVTSPKREWVTLVVTPLSFYTFADAVASYDFYHNITPDGYDWRIGAQASFDMMNQSYLASYFKSMGADAALKGAVNFSFAGGQSLLVNADAGFRMPLSADYLYVSLSEETGESIVAGFYPSELAYLKTQNIHAGLGVTYTLPIAKGKSNLYIKADGQYIKPLGVNTSRLIALATVGMLF